jgi:hypothetical protein
MAAIYGKESFSIRNQFADVVALKIDSRRDSDFERRILSHKDSTLGSPKFQIEEDYLVNPKKTFAAT